MHLLVLSMDLTRQNRTLGGNHEKKRIMIGSWTSRFLEARMGRVHSWMLLGRCELIAFTSVFH